MQPVAWSKQAGRISASLLFALLAGCAPAAQPTVTQAAATQAAPLPTPTLVPPTAAPTVEIFAVPHDYIVQTGDTVSSIAAQFGLQPETVLWANFAQLHDNPDFLMEGMTLLVLPVDGVYHQAGGSDTVTNVAAIFGADVQDIIDWPGNHIDPRNNLIFIGQYLVVPGGKQPLRRRILRNLPVESMAVSPEEYGSGACPQNGVQQITGDGVYAWPVTSHEVQAEGYWSAHQAVDLAVADGEAVLAADDGVVVYSGWTNENFGYGYVIMLDHGDGDFTLYGGLGDVTAVCGSAVHQGDPIGVGGLIGHPAGAFLHFEIRRGDEFLNPLDLLN